jgi:hypothetical protein
MFISLQSTDWQTTERTVVKHLLEDCQAAALESITLQEMRRAIGVLEVNCYEVDSFVRNGLDLLSSLLLCKNHGHTCVLRRHDCLKKDI